MMQKFKPNLVYQQNDEAPVQIGDSRTFRFVFSTGDVDLEGDAINPKGWRLDDFNRNPIALWSHSVNSPIGRASNVHVEGVKLVGDIEFMSAEISPMADEIFKMVKAGFVKGVSVGFLPIKSEIPKDRHRGKNYLEQKLLEISVCAVPANPSALIQQAKSKGMAIPAYEAWAARHRMKQVNNPITEEILMSVGSMLKSLEREIARLKSTHKDADVERLDDADDTTPELAIKAAHAHMKAARGLFKAAGDLHEECMRCLKSAMDGSGEEEAAEDEKPEDDKPDEKADDAPADDDDDEEAKKILSRSRARSIGLDR